MILGKKLGLPDECLKSFKIFFAGFHSFKKIRKVPEIMRLQELLRAAIQI